MSTLEKSLALNLDRPGGLPAARWGRAARALTPPPLGCLRSRVGERSGGKGGAENVVSSSLGNGSEKGARPGVVAAAGGGRAARAPSAVSNEQNLTEHHFPTRTCGHGWKTWCGCCGARGPLPGPASRVVKKGPS